MSQDNTKTYPIAHNDAHWRELLSDIQYQVTRHAGTERAFTGEYTDTKDEGIYRCVCCKSELFRSSTKFHSGCGWPSFYDTDAPHNVEERQDNTHGMRRTEVLCAQCGAHLGHVFPDGPAPTGNRYCINSASLSFEPA